MANTFQGVGILWGFPGGPTGTLTGSAIALTNVQSLDFSRKSQEEKVADGTGNTAGVAFFDHADETSIDFVYSSGSLTGSCTVTGVPSSGALITLTDSNLTPVGATWICRDFSFTRGNTKAMMAKVSLVRFINNAGVNGMPS